MLLGKLTSGLYHIQSKVFHGASTSSANFSAAANNNYCLSIVDTAKLWHLRLGHLPFSRIKLLLPDCDISACLHDVICQVCPMAKLPRKSFPHSSLKTSKPFEMLHIDVWGPYKVKTHSGCTQFLTILDDFTRFTWVHLIKFKTDVISILDAFFSYIETQFSSKVLCIRSDNAKELGEGPMKAIYSKRGIIHQTSCSDTPQQNGVVERKHRHLLEIARALSFHSNIPGQFWGDCVVCAAYLINRMPLSSIQNVAPYEKLFNQPPSLEHLKTFGCLVYFSTSNIHRTKFDPRASPGIFLGYSLTQKGYKVWNLSANKLCVTRDLIFYKKHFPYHLQTHSSPPPIFTSASTYDFFSDDDYPPNSSSQSPSPTIPSDHSPTPDPSLSFSSSPESSFSSSEHSVTPTEPPTDPTTLIDLSTTIPAPRKSTRIHKTPA